MTTPTPLLFSRLGFARIVSTCCLPTKWIVEQCIIETHSLKQTRIESDQICSRSWLLSSSNIASS